MNEIVKRSPSEILRRGYSEDELTHIYELGRFSVENGDLQTATSIFAGINQIASDFAPAWLGSSYIHLMNKDFEHAITCANNALRSNPQMAEATLYLVACLLSIGDINTAGTYLGEIGERIDAGSIDEPNLIRFYRIQLARYQTR